MHIQAQVCMHSLGRVAHRIYGHVCVYANKNKKAVKCYDLTGLQPPEIMYRNFIVNKYQNICF